MKKSLLFAIIAMIASLSFGQSLTSVNMTEKKSVIQKEALVSPSTTQNKVATKEVTELVATRASQKYYDEGTGNWFIVLWDDLSFVFRFDIVTNSSAPLELGHTYTLADMDPGYSWYGLDVYTGVLYADATLTPRQGAYGIDYEATVTLVDGRSYHVTYTAHSPESKVHDIDVLAVQSQYYEAPYNVWDFTFNTKDYDFSFTFPNLDESGIEMDKVYTLDDMDAEASVFQKVKNLYIYFYKSVTFLATRGANGIDYTITAVDNFDETYNLTYTAPASPEPAKVVEMEFTKDETELVDYTSWFGTFQFNGKKEDGFKAYVSLMTFDDVPGNYTYRDVFVESTILYLNADDEEGVRCYDLTATVTEYEGGAYKAVVDYYGRDGVLYKLTFNYGDVPFSAITGITTEPTIKTIKTIKNGQVVIVKGDMMYNVAGQPIK